jgi:hypothetical protein
MLVLLLLIGGYAGWRLVAAALLSLRSLPRSNEDMIFY